jgi:hypothetical protein
MELTKIDRLIHKWDALTDEVIALDEIEPTEVKRLFRETYEVLDVYSKDELVPKSISKLLLEMNDFARWVYDLHESPLHKHYQEILSLVMILNKHFMTRDADIDKLSICSH